MSEPPAVRRPRILPPVWLALAGIAMYALDRWLPLVDLAAAGRGPVALLFIALGLGILGTAVASFIRARTGLVPFSAATTLVRSGLYRFTRNPMYLGMVLLLIGSAIAFGSAGAWLPVPLFAWVIREQYIRPEERFLLGIYGRQYEEYCREVRRWI